MKTILTTIVLFFCVGAMAQSGRIIDPNNETPCQRFHIEHPESLVGCIDSPDNVITPFKIWSEQPIWHTVFVPNHDTLTITDTSIHFIKIGEQVFEIKRSATLEPAKPKEPQGYFFPYYPIDTSGIIRSPLLLQNVQLFNACKQCTPASK